MENVARDLLKIMLQISFKGITHEGLYIYYLFKGILTLYTEP